MQKIAFTFLLLLFFSIQVVKAQSDTIRSENVELIGWDEQVNEALTPATEFITSIVFFTIPIGDKEVPFVLIWLLAGAIIFTVYMKFVNITGFKHAIDIVRGKYDDPEDPGEVSHFQALTAALSGTVGLGNIAGVAIAISIGGPGATFWMIIAGLLGMSSKFVECTLGVMYRNIAPDGDVSGGPMYFLSKAFKEKGKLWGGFGSFLAILFSIMCIGGSFGGGNMFQVNQACQQFIDITGGESSFLYGKGWLFGIVVAILVAFVIIGGIKSIAKVTDKIVPFMCGVYVIAALLVIFGHFTHIPAAFMLIIKGAFAPGAALGGVVGVLIAGFQRAAFSNEAGIGSASIAHSAVKTDEPVTEGLVALLEPFIDTVVICTMTALVIVITGAYDNSGGIDGISLTSGAFESVIPGSRYVLAVAVILFAFSTMISWSYYGLKAWTFIFGDNTVAEITYKIIFCGFVVIGASMSLGNVISFSDAMIFAMCFPNIIGLVILAPKVKFALNSFVGRIKSGEIKTFK